MIRRWLAQRRLAQMVERNRNAPATISYRKHREAMAKHTRGVEA